MTVQRVASVAYGYSLSTVFEGNEKPAAEDSDEDDDPVMERLRFLDYRYIRFIFNPSRGRFIFDLSKRDKAWSSIKSAKIGLDAEDRHQKEKVFGPNLIDIREKSIPQLLVDEVKPSTQPVRRNAV